MKRRIFSLLLALVLVLGGLSPLGAPGGTAQAAGFRDVSSGAWYADYVRRASDEGLMSGTSEDRFSPDTTLTRAMFITILGRLHGVKPETYDYTVFADAQKDTWYGPYVSWGYSIRIVSGYGGGFGFGSEDPITREQMASILARYIEFLGVELPDGEDAVSSFRDSGKVSSWARQGVELMRRTGVLSGDQNRNFRPGATALRSEAATIFVRLMDALNAARNELPEDNYEAVEQVADDFRSVERAYTDADGVIPAEKAEDALEAMEDAADRLLADGAITYWDEDNGQITYQLKNGLLGAYFPSYEGTDELAGTGGGIISVYQPVLAEEGFTDASKKYGSLSTAAKKIISASQKYTSGANLTNGAVTLESLKQWQSGSIIVWSGHGAYSDRVKEYFITGEDVTEQNMERYRADYEAGRLLAASWSKGSDIAVTSKFFDYYYDQDDLKGTLIFMGACNGLRDNTMANLMTEKLGATYIGSTSIIYIPYLHNLQLSFLERMATKGPDGRYYTAQQALDYAKEQHPVLENVGKAGTYIRDFLLFYDDATTQVLLKGDGSISLNSDLRSRTVRVLGPSGDTGVAGATVSLYAKGVGGPALQTVKTDAQGYCTLKDLSDSVSYTVDIQAEGYGLNQGIALPSGDPAVIRLSYRASTLNITVKSADGGKLGLYEIYVRDLNGNTKWEKSNGFSDQITVTETASGLSLNTDYKIQASASFYTPVIQSVRTSQGVQNVEIELYRGTYGFKGKVVDDATGRPIQGVKAELVSKAGSVYATATTDSTGSFQVMGTAGLVLYRLRLSGSGYETMSDLGSDKILGLNTPADLGTIRMTAAGGSTQPVEPEPSQPVEPTQPEQDGEYTLIYTESDLAAISGKPGKYKLACDITASNYGSRIGGLVSKLDKDAVLDGDGHTIRVNVTNGFDTGIVTQNEGIIRNLKVTGTATLSDEITDYGTIVGRNSGLIENCSFSGTIRSTSGKNAFMNGVGIGGICGWNSGTIRNCTMDGSISMTLQNSNWSIGGICGYAETGASLENCINRATVTVQVTGGAGGSIRRAYVGGICGRCYGYEDINLTDCLNTANITARTTDGETCAGGVCAWSGTLEGCANTGACITASGYDSGNYSFYYGSQAAAVGMNENSTCYCSDATTLVDKDGTRSVSESTRLTLRTTSEILEMW